MNEMIIKCIEDEISDHILNCSEEHLYRQKRTWLRFPRDIPMENRKLIENYFKFHKIVFLNSTDVKINLIN